MATIDRNESPMADDVKTFLEQINFVLPKGFVEFYTASNGAEISSDDNYASLWPLTDMFQLNLDYNVEEYAPEFFIFGSDGGGNAYAIEKSTSNIYMMPFIGMSKEEAVFLNSTFTAFIEMLLK
ncbi:MAG: SMI1/KNR4 family protein [Chitinophagales bacterium]|nr:SMI1/KNR4 family protein [Chitinophagales bacterium]